MSPPSKPSFKTFIKQFTQRPNSSKEDELLSTSPPVSLSISPPPSRNQRPQLQHKSRSSSAIITVNNNNSNNNSNNNNSTSHHHHHHHHHHHDSFNNTLNINNISGSPPPSSTIGSYNNLDLDSNGIFGVSLEDSVKYASATINIRDKNNQSAVGKIPILVANCAKFLKRDATKTEGIFRVSGSARRIKELQAILTDPKQNFGKDLDWTPYTVHDAANILRRYLNHLPEPIIPLKFYEKFRNPLFKYPSVIEHLQGGNAISATTPPSSTTISPLIKTVEDAATGAATLPSIPSVISSLETSKGFQSTHSELPTVKENIEEPTVEKPFTSPSQESDKASKNTLEESKPETEKASDPVVDPETTATNPLNSETTTTTAKNNVNDKEDVKESSVPAPLSAEELTLMNETKLAIKDYCELIDQLPILNQQLLLYILDLLYTFSKESEYNLMPAVNLASIFQPSILSHPSHNMAPQQYHLSRAVTQFLIENFLQLTISVRTWISNSNTNGSNDSSNTRNLTPGHRTSGALPITQRRHSKSMSSVTIPSNVKDLIKDPVDPLNSASGINSNLYPNSVSNNNQDGQFFKSTVGNNPTQVRKSSIPQNDGSASIISATSGRNSPALSPMVSPSEKPIAGFFQALKRGASLSRRRTSSTSTTSSSVLGLDHSNSSASSLPRQTVYSQNLRTSSIPNSIHQLSEADEIVATATTTETTPVVTTDDAKPPQKSLSSATITPTRRTSNNQVEGTKIPVITTTSMGDKSSTVGNPCVLSETESEHETSQSEMTENKTKKHRRSISSLLSRRSGSPALNLGQSSAFKTIDNHRLYNSLSELPVSIDSALASPSIRSERALSPSENSLGTSPKTTKSLAFFAGGLSNDSSSSVGIESDDDGFSYSGAKNFSASPGASSSTNKKVNSRWRRSLMKFNIPVQSPDITEEHVSSPLYSYDPKHAASLDQMLSPAMSPPEPTGSPGTRLMRKFNRRKRDSRILNDESATSATAADTSDSGFSN